jgi:hypothetical protein
MTKRRDPMDRAIESALQAGHFIGWSQGTAFVSGLENLEREIAALAPTAQRVLPLFMRPSSPPAT